MVGFRKSRCISTGVWISTLSKTIRTHLADEFATFSTLAASHFARLTCQRLAARGHRVFRR
jgi:hypothetical protein